MADRSIRLLALGREEAKQVFSKRDAAALGEFVDLLWADAKRVAEARNLDTGFDSTDYAASIAAAATLDEAGRALLQRGGRLLPSTAGSEIYLLRPDLIGPLSLAASNIENIGQFLHSAASRNEAVLILY